MHVLRARIWLKPGINRAPFCQFGGSSRPTAGRGHLANEDEAAVVMAQNTN